ncbi:MAG: hypothetical protein GY935_08910 [Gammaproteobacteria bacterium]|nr:hypothetical protein [Gammaproteobacteria bacterium]
MSTSKSSARDLPASSATEAASPNHSRSILFPQTFRQFRYRRELLNILRAAHILCLSLLLGGFFFEQPQALIKPWFIGTLVSGLAIFLIDLHGSCIALFEVRGISVLIKLGLLLLLPFLQRDFQLYLLVVLIVFSSLISHSRRGFRHRSFMSRQFQQRYGVR